MSMLLLLGDSSLLINKIPFVEKILATVLVFNPLIVSDDSTELRTVETLSSVFADAIPVGAVFENVISFTDSIKPPSFFTIVNSGSSFTDNKYSTSVNNTYVLLSATIYHLSVLSCADKCKTPIIAIEIKKNSLFFIIIKV